MSQIILPSNEIITPKLSDIEFRAEFKKRLIALQEWGIKEGQYITAYLDIKPEGAIPTIGYRPLTQDEQTKVN